MTPIVMLLVGLAHSVEPEVAGPPETPDAVTTAAPPERRLPRPERWVNLGRGVGIAGVAAATTGLLLLGRDGDGTAEFALVATGAGVFVAGAHIGAGPYATRRRWAMVAPLVVGDIVLATGLVGMFTAEGWDGIGWMAFTALAAPVPYLVQFVVNEVGVPSLRREVEVQVGLVPVRDGLGFSLAARF